MVSRTGFGPQVTTSKQGRKPQNGNGRAPVPAAPTNGKAKPSNGTSPAPISRSLGDYRGAPLTPEQSQALERWSRRARQGPAVHMTMTCRGPECVFAPQCPLIQEGVAEPIGQECPVEEHLHDLWVTDFMAGLHVDEGHPDYPIIRALVADLAMDLKVQNRIAWQLAQDPAPVTKETIGINNNGQPIEIRKVHPGLEFLNRLGSKKLRMLREILATPRSKAEAGRMGWKDPGTQAASAQAKAEELRRLAGRRRDDDDLPVRFTEIHLGDEASG